jgi:hypothetical protein
MCRSGIPAIAINRLAVGRNGGGKTRRENRSVLLRSISSWIMFDSVGTRGDRLLGCRRARASKNPSKNHWLPRLVTFVTVTKVRRWGDV